MIDAFAAKSWRADYLGESWPVRVFLAGDALTGDRIAEPTLVLFDRDSRPAHRLPLAVAEAIAGLPSEGPAPAVPAAA